MPRLGTRAALAAALLVCVPATAHATTLDNTSDPMDYLEELDGGGLGVGGLGTSATFVAANGNPQSHSDAERLFSAAPDALGLTSGIVLTTGSANAMLTASDPGYQAAIWSDADNEDSSPPADYLQAHGGTFPNSPGSPNPADAVAYDSSMLEFELVPAGTKLRLSWIFATEEWSHPQWDPAVGVPYNDQAVVLVDSTSQAGNPTDRNCATVPGDGAGTVLPATVNTIGLNATGIVRTDSAGELTSFNGLTTVQTCEFHVVPHETITVRIGVWDVSDGESDSALILGSGSLSSDAVPTVVLERTGGLDLTAEFSTAGSGDDDAVADWTMAYGDGETETGTGAPPATFTHTYAEAGTYEATLTLVDTAGQEWWHTIPVTVTAPAGGGNQAPPPPGGGGTTPDPFTATLSGPAAAKLRKGFAFGLTCSLACTAEGTLTIPRKAARKARVRRTIARATLADGTLALKLKRKTARRLRKRFRRVRATLTVVATSADGRTSTQTATVSLRR